MAGFGFRLQTAAQRCRRMAGTGEGDSPFDYKIIKLNKVRSPSVRFGFLESNSNGACSDGNTSLLQWLEVDPTGGYEGVAYRHNGGTTTNIAFYDGHVEGRRSERVVSPRAWCPGYPNSHLSFYVRFCQVVLWYF